MARGAHTNATTPFADGAIHWAEGHALLVQQESRSCALVGGGLISKPGENQSLGSEIDAHDIVVRINRLPFQESGRRERQNMLANMLHAHVHVREAWHRRGRAQRYVVSRTCLCNHPDVQPWLSAACVASVALPTRDGNFPFVSYTLGSAERPSRALACCALAGVVHVLLPRWRLAALSSQLWRLAASHRPRCRLTTRSTSTASGYRQSRVSCRTR